MSDVELTVFVHHQTSNAILASDDGDEERAVWIPKSKIVSFQQIGKTTDIVQTFEISIPEWLAREKELI